MQIRIAVVQFKITHHDGKQNFQRIEGFIKEAVEQKANVVVFPEDCITGSIFGDLTKLDTNNANCAAFRELACKYHIDIVTGSSMEGRPEGNFKYQLLH